VRSSGGTGAVLVFERSDLPPAASSAPAEREIVITGVSSFGPGGPLTGVDTAVYATPSRSEPTVAAVPDALSLLEPGKSRRFDESSALVTLGAEQALADAAAVAEDTGLVCGTAYGNVQRSVAFLRRVSERGPRLASPADFPHLGPIFNERDDLHCLALGFGKTDNVLKSHFHVFAANLPAAHASHGHSVPVHDHHEKIGAQDRPNNGFQ
jgi:hypothetical protein